MARRLASVGWIVLVLLAAPPGARAQGAPIDVAALERRLAALGFDPGPIDGVFDGRTRGALRAFQRGQGLTPTGQPDASTMAALGHPAPARVRPTAASGAFLPRRVAPGAEAPPPKAAPVAPVETEALPPP